MQQVCIFEWAQNRIGFEIEYLLMARLFQIQYQNQYLYFLAIITNTDINIAQEIPQSTEQAQAFYSLTPVLGPFQNHILPRQFEGS